jgi:hypothetical protein
VKAAARQQAVGGRRLVGHLQGDGAQTVTFIEE